MSMPTCLNCDKPVNTKRNKYCSVVCQNGFQNKQRVKDLIDGKYVGKELQFIDSRTPNPKARQRGGTNWAKQWMLEWNDYQCQECGIETEWNGNYLVLQVEHIDGQANNNDIENLCLLCPNCHSQTETWGFKMGPKRVSDRNNRRVDVIRNT